MIVTRKITGTDNAIGFAAVTVSMMIQIPQLYKIYTSGESKDLSCLTYILLCTSSMLWIIYHYRMGTPHGMLSGGITLLMSAIILYLIIDQNRVCV
jgi:uncharacterized protein with PQ loop repeat